jgi:tetratricopeptide (TPR) repeat protein
VNPPLQSINGKSVSDLPSARAVFAESTPRALDFEICRGDGRVQEILTVQVPAAPVPDGAASGSEGAAAPRAIAVEDVDESEDEDEACGGAGAAGNGSKGNAAGSTSASTPTERVQEPAPLAPPAQPAPAEDGAAAHGAPEGQGGAPAEWEAEAARGAEAFEANRWGDAADHLTAAIAAAPTPVPAALYIDRAAARLQAGDAHASLHDAEAAVAAAPASARALLRRGLALLALERPEEAAGALREARRLAPADVQAVGALLRAETALGGAAGGAGGGGGRKVPSRTKWTRLVHPSLLIGHARWSRGRVRGATHPRRRRARRRRRPRR